MCAHYTVRNLSKSSVFSAQVHNLQKLSLVIPQCSGYNNYIDYKESQMSDNEFFRFDQEAWYGEWVDTEVREIVGDTNPHSEIFEFDDVPY